MPNYWTTPKTWTFKELVAYTDLNTYVRDQQKHLIENYPQRFAAFWDELTVVTGNAIALYTLSTSQPHNAIWYQTAGANGDKVAFSCPLLAGNNYVISLMGGKVSSAGKTAVYLNGTQIGSTLDWYNGTTAYNQVQTITFNVAASRRQLFEIVVDGKNASSSGYNIFMTRIWIKPATDSN